MLRFRRRPPPVCLSVLAAPCKHYARIRVRHALMVPRFTFGGLGPRWARGRQRRAHSSGEPCNA
eukprot:8833437-Pyramimonas_sp.AAC.2